MLGLLKGKIKNIVSIIALACFLSTPLTYLAQPATADAAIFHRDRGHHHGWHKDHWDDDRWDDDRWDHDDDKDFDKGDIAAAVVIGGVVGAVIANNT